MTQWCGAQGFSASCAWKHLHDHAFKTETYYTVTAQKGYKTMFSLQRALRAYWPVTQYDIFHLLDMQHGLINKAELQIPTLLKKAISVEWSEKPHRRARKWGFFFRQEAGGAGGSLQDLHTLSRCVVIPQRGFVAGWGRSSPSASSLEMRLLQQCLLCLLHCSPSSDLGRKFQMETACRHELYNSLLSH